MTVEELLNNLGIEKIHLDNFAQNNEYLKYEVLLNIEFENEAYEIPERINIEIESIEIDNKFKTIKLIGD
jgi:hypothetical protein